MYMNEESLMRSRIRKILMICSNYDAFSLEEDGRVESQIVSEYRELNLSNRRAGSSPPTTRSTR